MVWIAVPMILLGMEVSELFPWSFCPLLFVFDWLIFYCFIVCWNFISLCAEILHSKVSLIIYRSLYHVRKIYKELSHVYIVSIFCWWLDWGNVCKLDCWTVYLRFLQFGHKLSDPDDQCFTRYISPFKDLDSGYPTLLL